MKYAFSDKRDITDAFPISSRRATNTNWGLFDIHDDDGSETLSARSRPIFPQDEDEMQEVPKKSKRFWERKGHKQNREPEKKDAVSGGHIKEQENEGAHEESQEDKKPNQSEVPEREQLGKQDEEQEPEEHGESQADKALDQSGVPRREQFEEQGQEEEEQELGEHEESQEDKTLDQDEVPERGQEQEKVSKQCGESQEDEPLDQDKDSRDGQSKLRTAPELAQPTPVDIAPKPKARKLKGRLVGKMLEDSQDIMRVEDPRESDVVIP